MKEPTTEVIDTKRKQVDYNKLKQIYNDSCFCACISTDMETYIEIQADKECLVKLLQNIEISECIEGFKL